MVAVKDDIAAVDFVLPVVGPAVLIAEFVVTVGKIIVVLRPLEVVFLVSVVVVVRVI